jgi:signal transduction histidine kinase
MLGKPIALLIPEDLVDEEPVILKRIRSGERIEHYETKRVRKDGSVIDISLTVSPIKNRQGVVIGASKIARDITGRRRMETEWQAANRVKEEFLAVLSHELRTPLNAILGWTSILGASRNEDMIQHAVEVIQRNAEMQKRLIEDLLDMSREISVRDTGEGEGATFVVKLPSSKETK